MRELTVRLEGVRERLLKFIGVVIVTVLLTERYYNRFVRVEVMLKVPVGLVDRGFVIPLRVITI